jgi:hypothetical protein
MMTISFDLGAEGPSRFAPSMDQAPYVCEVVLEDERGKEWTAVVRDTWVAGGGLVTP